MNGYFYVLTIINLFVLSFMCILTKLSEALSKKQKQGFVCAFVLIAGISVLEVITLIVDGKPSSYRWLNIMSNYLGFGLSPAVAICLVYVLDKKTTFKREFKMAVYCELGYLIFLALSIPHGIVFSVDADNIYSRGQYFCIYVIMYFTAILYLSISTIIKAREFQNRSRKLIYPLIVFLTAETIIQVMSPELRVTWLCVTLQSSYLNRTEEMRYSGGVLIVFDVNDFKMVNDDYGHLQGDICLAAIADCIKKAYACYGYCYRIGGDEFCVLLKNGEKEEECLHEFMNRLEERRKEITFLPIVSFGSSVFSGEDINVVKEIADRNMYQCKKEQKNRVASQL